MQNVTTIPGTFAFEPGKPPKLLDDPRQLYREEKRKRMECKDNVLVDSKARLMAEAKAEFDAAFKPSSS